ncbi:50S ribosomal protein L18a [Methanosarcinaceae archaeon]|nr:50S ribosomal protein L18a [Methanosarcinaceae archaeon]MBQ3620295.1 50S ribosomal protein L18a [Methanosarcinaceae archaeon]
MSTFVIKGQFKTGFDWEKFTKTVESLNEKNAVEKVYSTIGSQHGLPRRLIRIESVSAEE